MSKVSVSQERIQELLPHREPFLFVDRVTELEPNVRILAERTLRPDEPHFKGHFPGNPIMPGVLIAEALAQTAGLLLALSSIEKGEEPRGRLFYLAKADVKWTSPAIPGETLLLEAKLERSLGPLVLFGVKAFTKRKDVARGSLALARIEQK